MNPKPPRVTVVFFDDPSSGIDGALETVLAQTMAYLEGR